MKVYYRVLDDADDPNRRRRNSTKRRWDRGKYNSTHAACPKEWLETYRKNENDYRLRCSWGLHTDAALDCFRKAMLKCDAEPTEWPRRVLAKVGELDGTCAFQHPEEAWAYVLGCTNSDTAIEISEMVLHQTWVVEFEGEDLGIAIPEAQGGGVLVRVKSPGSVYTAEEFARRHGYDIRLAEDGGEIDLRSEHDS